MGNCTYTERAVTHLGRLRCKIGDVTLSSSYATGGDAAAPSLFGLNEILWAEFDAMPSGIKLDYIKVSPQSGPTTLNTVKAWCPTGGGGTAPTSVANASAAATGTAIAASTATPASGATAVTSTSAQPAIPVTFGTITQPTITMTPGTAVEYGATTNLSTVTGRIILFGY